MLFDGESALASRHVQKQIQQRFNLKVYAQPYYKRNLAERFVKEFKLRIAVLLELEGELCTLIVLVFSYNLFV